MTISAFLWLYMVLSAISWLIMAENGYFNGYIRNFIPKIVISTLLYG